MSKSRKLKPLLRRPVKQKNPEILKKIALALLITVFAALIYTNIAHKTDEARQRIELQKTIQQLQSNKKQLNQLKSESTVQEQERLKTIDDLNKQLQEKEAQLQAKRSAPTAMAAAPVKQSAPVAASGTCEQWMSQAGVPINYASKKLIINESGCRPDAVNPSSGACGIPQALPCSKMPCTLQDPVCQLRWMQTYVQDRYTTWEGALSFWHCIGTCSNNYGPTVKTNTWY